MSANLAGLIFLVLAIPAAFAHHLWCDTKNRKVLGPDEQIGSTALKVYDGIVVVIFVLFAVGFFYQGGAI